MDTNKPITGHRIPVTILSWPNAILHIDGDSFFASVEQALNPNLKGKPVVTGQERGIASAMSYEAKALGITRGMPVGLIKRNYPSCIIVPGNYEAYVAFAKRMFTIMRTYTPTVEEYSIDEAFADITGMRKVLNDSYEGIARRMQTEIEKDLDITVSVGVSLSKSLAKLCSKFRKPHGVTVVKGKYIHILLQKTPLEKVWGIGHNIGSFLKKHGCVTAYDFVSKPLPFVEQYLTKKEVEIYKELRGEMIYPLDINPKVTYKNISKGKTFEPTQDKNLIFAQLTKNIEEATAKVRKYKLTAKKFYISLKTQGFIYHGRGVTLNRTTANHLELIEFARALFEQIHNPQEVYRSTLCYLADLRPDTNQQLSLFDDPLRIEKYEQLNNIIDELNKTYGQGTVHVASSLSARYKEVQESKLPMLDYEV